MKTPLIAIVGRPNVGKSTFFNRVLSQRQAIVDPTEGITRDRIYEKQNGAGKGLGLLTLEVSFLKILIFLMLLYESKLNWLYKRRTLYYS